MQGQLRNWNDASSWWHRGHACSHHIAGLLSHHRRLLVLVWLIRVVRRLLHLLLHSYWVGGHHVRLLHHVSLLLHAHIHRWLSHHSWLLQLLDLAESLFHSLNPH